MQFFKLAVTFICFSPRKQSIFLCNLLLKLTTYIEALIISGGLADLKSKLLLSTFSSSEFILKQMDSV